MTNTAFDWVLQVMCENGHRVLAELHEYKRRPYLMGSKPVPDKEQEVTKLLKRPVSWLTRLKGFILGRAPETRTLDELRVVRTGIAVERGEDEPVTTPQLKGGIDDIPTAATTQAEFDGQLYVAQSTTTEQLNAHAERMGIDLPGPDETDEVVVTHLVLLDAQGNPAQPEPMYDALNALDKRVHASFGKTPAEMGIVPLEVDDFTLTTPQSINETLEIVLAEGLSKKAQYYAKAPTSGNAEAVYESMGLTTAEASKLPELCHQLDRFLTADECSLTVALGNIPDDIMPYEVTAATQEVIDRLGGIVPDHHGHARKVMPLDGPTGKKSTYNARASKPVRKKKPRK